MSPIAYNFLLVEEDEEETPLEVTSAKSFFVNLSNPGLNSSGFVTEFAFGRVNDGLSRMIVKNDLAEYFKIVSSLNVITASSELGQRRIISLAANSTLDRHASTVRSPLH